MGTLAVILLRRKSICLLFAAILACDSFKEDFIEPKNQVTFSQSEFYILPGSATVFDFKSLIEKSFVSATLTIAENPTKGMLTQIDNFVWKYTPTVDFIGNRDQFSLSAELDDGTTIKTETMTIQMKESSSEFPCGVYPVEDRVRLKSTNPVVIHVLKNDHLCDLNESLEVLIHVAPKSGEAIVAGDSITYTPGPSFSDGDELVYGLSTSTGEVVSYGLVSFNKRKLEIFNLQSGFTDIFFVDDTTGFISGGADIYKTTDGGRHWNLQFYPTGLGDNVYFSEIFFLDKDNGFAALSRCPDFDDCWGGWMMTTNGGVTWKRINLDQRVNSIFFTSPLTGFMSTYRKNPGASLVHQAIFKTADGGETWDEVYRADSDFGALKIRFANDLAGYAYDGAAIYTTTDGGESWSRSADNKFVSSFAITSDEVTCASFSSGSISVTTPSTIVRAENGETWKPVTNFPYTILSQGFSPDGALGIAIGISGSNPSVDPASQILTISQSTDEGETWVDLTEQLDGFPLEISVPSASVAYILCSDKIIKYSP